MTSVIVLSVWGIIAAVFTIGALKKVINLEQRSNDMKSIIFWAVSPSRNFVHQLCTNDCIAANMAVRALRQMNDMPTDLTLCTNECATNFRNGMVFMDGKLYKRTSI